MDEEGAGCSLTGLGTHGCRQRDGGMAARAITHRQGRILWGWKVLGLCSGTSGGDLFCSACENKLVKAELQSECAYKKQGLEVMVSIPQ